MKPISLLASGEKKIKSYKKILDQAAMYLHCINMEATIQKWGNSLGIRIPKNLANDLHINEGSNVEISLEEDKIVIVRKEKISLKEKLQQITLGNLHNEISSGLPIGNEQW